MRCVTLRKRHPFWSLRRQRLCSVYYQEGSSFRACGNLSLLSSDPAWGIGVVVGRKIGPAVLRNKLKRRIRNAFHVLAKQNPSISLDCVITAQSKDVAGISFSQLMSSFNLFISRLKRCA